MRADTMTLIRLVRAVPATDTKDPRARRLKAVIGVARSVGIRTGKTVVERTCEYLFNISWKSIWKSSHMHNLA
jgi:hypothetical protein